MTAFAAIHVAKKQLDLDEDTYRAMLGRVTGKTSLKLMSQGELGLVLDEMRAKGAGQSLRPSSRLDGPYAKKLQALWISGWHLGVFTDRKDTALVAFVKRQTGIEATRFLREADQAKRVIEALKSWLAREAGVVWKPAEAPADSVILAQLRRLALPEGDGLASTARRVLGRGVSDGQKKAAMQLLGARIRVRG